MPPNFGWFYIIVPLRRASNTHHHIQTTTMKFERLRHIRYFSNCLQRLPKQYSSADTNRLTLVHFCVQALDILGCLPEHGVDVCGNVDSGEVYIPREGIIEWIYGLQTLPTKVLNDDDSITLVAGGFKGGTYLGPLPTASSPSSCDETTSESSGGNQTQKHPYDHSHLAMTYVALCTLVALGDDLSRVNKTAILQTLQSLQKEDGSFIAICSTSTATANEGKGQEEERTKNGDVKEDDDCDLRFMYTAIVIWYLLTKQEGNATTNEGDCTATNNDAHDSSTSPTINIQSATSYILSCITYDGSLGLTPGREGHGGSTFCGIASLHLMGVLDEAMARDELTGWEDDLIRWCVNGQYPLPTSLTNTNATNAGVYNNGYCNENAAGMAGRPNKLEDTCYSFWIGGTLHLLSQSHLLDGWALREYVLTCQSPYGGFGKVVGAMPDLLHSFYSLAWLALSEEQGCCDEDEVESGEDGHVVAGYDSEMRRQVVESIGQLSKLDCALGMCTKRKAAFHQ